MEKKMNPIKYLKRILLDFFVPLIERNNKKEDKND